MKTIALILTSFLFLTGCTGVPKRDKVNSEPHKSVEWYKNGQKKSESSIKDGKPIGLIVIIHLITP
ncbi:MAG TPA: hypothetical protein EYQ71_05730 [Candidatus Thioglobus sp.]|nr:hypothetical protein [Candidatus Thioglobus sp.]